MTQEEKDLLVQDLCSRLPYGVFMQLNNKSAYRPAKLVSIDVEKQLYNIGTIHEVPFNFAKPCLFPLSSMTEEQKIECFKGTPLEIDKYGDIVVKDNLCGCSQYTDLEIYLKVIDWLNKNHFDYRGLIEKSLAINCTKLNIY